MITSQEIKKVVLPCVALRKAQLTDKMLKCDLEELKAIRIAIDELKAFETLLERETNKESSEFINTINKD